MPHLDVESDDERRARLGRLFESLGGAGEADADGADGAPPFPLPPSRPHAVPESDALARARAFLPLMAASNADIAARRAKGEDVVIDSGIGRASADADAGVGDKDEDEEESGDSDSDSDEDDDDDDSDDEEDHSASSAAGAAAPTVEMDVGLGVFDVRGAPSADMGPVVERDARVWAAHAPVPAHGEQMSRAPLVVEEDEAMDQDVADNAAPSVAR